MVSVSEVLSGNRLALSRLLSQIENNTADGRAALDELFPHTGKAHLIGVTGAPGTGKSSLVNRLANHFRHPPAGETPRKVAIVAVDPTSPFTGGAILGDRIRMRDLIGDPGVFIRSMASRGALGGLARTTSGLVQAFDASGFDVVFIETVGAGQVEVDIARLAHTTLVIDAPGLGDDVQAIKAGILEIADIMIVNKADRPGAEQTVRALRSMLNLAHPQPRVFRHHGRLTFGNDWRSGQGAGSSAVGDSDGQGLEADSSGPDGEAEKPAMWITPLKETVAIQGEGILELAEAIADHYQFLKKTDEWDRRERARLGAELNGLLRDALVARWRNKFESADYEAVLARLVDRELSPYQAVGELIDKEGRA